MSAPCTAALQRGQKHRYRLPRRRRQVSFATQKRQVERVFQARLFAAEGSIAPFPQPSMPADVLAKAFRQQAVGQNSQRASTLFEVTAPITAEASAQSVRNAAGNGRSGNVFGVCCGKETFSTDVLSRHTLS